MKVLFPPSVRILSYHGNRNEAVFSFLALSAELWPCDPNAVSEVHGNCKKSGLRNPRKRAVKTIGKSGDGFLGIRAEGWETSTLCDNCQNTSCAARKA